MTSDGNTTSNQQRMIEDLANNLEFQEAVMSDSIKTYIVNDTRYILQEGEQRVIYVHTDFDGDLFVTKEGADGLEHEEGRCHSKDCHPFLAIVFFLN